MTVAFKRMTIICCLAIASIVWSLNKGSTPVSWFNVTNHDHAQFNMIFFKLRLPRTITAFTNGALLALSGSLMQLLLQNPLADPYVLGISSGAAFFTLLMIFLGISSHYLLIGAWMGSLLTAGLILILARQHRWQIHTLLLTGIAIAGGFSAGISLILLISPDSSLHSMLFWLAGDLNDTTLSTTNITVLLVGGFMCWALAPAFNLLGHGEVKAQALGVHVQQYRFLLFILSSLFAAAAVTQVGCIGFVGLVVPHFARKLVGFDHRIMLPTAIVLGGTLITIADTIARTVVAPQQLPTGVIMAIIGIPIFIGLMQHGQTIRH